MYKKLMLSVLLSFAMFGAFTVVKADASDISLTLCDDSYKDFMLDSWEEKDFCFTLKNKSSEEYVVTYGFTESIINNIWRQLCNGWVSADNSFSAIFTKPEPKDIEIGSGESKTITERIRVPVGMTGTVYGCVSYTVKGSAHQTKWSIFEVLISRTLPLKIFIGKMTDIKNDIRLIANRGGSFTTNNKIKANMDQEDNLNVSFIVENKWNVEQEVIITGKIYNILWFEKEFTTPTKTVAVNGTWEFTANVGILPFYKGFFSVKLNIVSKPSFAFDAKWLDESIVKWQTQKDSGNIYIFSWASIIALIVLVFIIIKILPFRFKKKPTVV